MVFEEVTQPIDPFNGRAQVLTVSTELLFAFNFFSFLKLKKFLRRLLCILHSCLELQYSLNIVVEKFPKQNVNYILQAMSQQMKVSLEKVFLFSYIMNGIVGTFSFRQYCLFGAKL